MDEASGFGGAKAALFIGGAIVTILRDDRPGLPYAGYWDLPGGGREGDETPFDCLRRETREEIGLDLMRKHVLWQKGFITGHGLNWFFVARLEAGAADRIVLGSEGQRWCMMDAEAYIAHPLGIPRFQQRLRLAMSDEGVVQRIPPLP